MYAKFTGSMLAASRQDAFWLWLGPGPTPPTYPHAREPGTGIIRRTSVRRGDCAVGPGPTPPTYPHAREPGTGIIRRTSVRRGDCAVQPPTPPTYPRADRDRVRE